MKSKRNRPLNEKKREAILKAAIEEFHTKGYDGSSMDTISKKANVSKATVYNHFKNKEKLFLALADILLTRLEESFRYEYNHDKTIEVQLQEIIYKDLRFLNDKENTKLIHIMMIVMIQKNNIGLKLINKSKDVGLDMTAMWFEKAKKDGKLMFDDSLFVAKQFIGMIKSFAFLPQMYGAPKLTQREENTLVKNAIDMIIKLYSTNKNC